MINLSHKQLWMMAIVVVTTVAIALLGVFAPPETPRGGAALHAVPGPSSPVGAAGVMGWFSPDGPAGRGSCASVEVTAWKGAGAQGMTGRTPAGHADGSSTTIDLPLRI